MLTSQSFGYILFIDGQRDADRKAEKKMKPQEILAISKVFGSKSKEYCSAMGEIQPGTYDVDTVVHVKGKVNVGIDTTMAPTASLLSQDFLIAVLKCAGVTRGAALDVIQSVASDYLRGWNGSDDDKAIAKANRKELVEEFDPDGKIQAVFSSFKESLPRIPKRGNVSWKGSVDEVKSTTIEIAEEHVVKVA